MKKPSLVVVSAIITFLIIGGILLALRLQIPPSVTFSNDAAEYHNGAIAIVRTGQYFYDGIFITEREPGYSMFLALIYLIFGEGNRGAIFTAQLLLHLGSVLIFLKAFRNIASKKVVMLCGAFLLFIPSVFHNALMVNREVVALSFFLLFAAGFIQLTHKPDWKYALFTGIAFGAGILTNISFFLFPIPLFVLALYLKIPKRFLLPLLGIPLCFLSVWGIRNASHGIPHLLRPFRTAQIWSIRAIQAENQSFADPPLCLWNEYISRDWKSIPRSECRPDGFIHDDRAVRFLAINDESAKKIASEARRRILKNLPMYLWGSVFWALEFHLPYVNGWGFLYNVLTALSTVILYIGCILYCIRIRKNWHPLHLLFFLLILYGTGIFSAAYSVPRFRMPILFCYCALSAIGYVSFIKKNQTSACSK